MFLNNQNFNQQQISQQNYNYPPLEDNFNQVQNYQKLDYQIQEKEKIVTIDLDNNGEDQNKIKTAQNLVDETQEIMRTNINQAFDQKEQLSILLAKSHRLQKQSKEFLKQAKKLEEKINPPFIKAKTLFIFLFIIYLFFLYWLCDYMANTTYNNHKTITKSVDIFFEYQMKQVDYFFAKKRLQQ